MLRRVEGEARVVRHAVLEEHLPADSFLRTHSDPDPDTGVIAPAASSQNGRDAVVTKISEAGVFEGIFAVDTMPVDGKYDDTSLNSGWGGYSWFSDLDSFAASGDNDNMVAMLGAIMPDPLETPMIFTFLFPILLSM